MMKGLYEEAEPAVPRKWLVCPKFGLDAQLWPFLFPYAGASSMIFHNWHRHLPSIVETQIVHLPGRGRRRAEPLTHDFQTVVAQLGEAIVPLLDRPFAFFGHNMGTLLAFEVVRFLRRAGYPELVQLLVSGRGASMPLDP